MKRALRDFVRCVLDMVVFGFVISGILLLIVILLHLLLMRGVPVAYYWIDGGLC